MKTIAVIASCDTKFQEVQYMQEILRAQDVKPLVVDMSIGPEKTNLADISREEVFEEENLKWSEIKSGTKGELMELMISAMKKKIYRLYEEGKIAGVIAAGGVQNTTVATQAMHELPIGFPKVMVTTIASGNKCFKEVVGYKDIVVFPSIVDFTGMNSVIGTILKNACISVAGMAKHADGQLVKPKKPVVGITMMGITNKGCMAAVRELERKGFEVWGFHATGAGGAVMEKLALEGKADGILDMTTHEIVSGYFEGGFSYGEYERLQYLRKGHMPVVVSVGGLDFIDYDIGEFPYPLDQRKYNKHNERLAHIKLKEKEARRVAELFTDRLNAAGREVELILPTDGMRCDTRPGEALYDSSVDDTLLKVIEEKAGENVHIQYLKGNLDSEEWGIRAARYLAEKLDI